MTRISTLPALAVAACLAMAGCTGSSDVSTPRTPVSTSEAGGGAPDRAAHTATTLSADLALVAGGCVSNGCGEASEQSFLLTSSETHLTGAMNQPRDAHTATRLPDGRVLVTGGFSAEGEPPLRTSEVYDLADGSWSATGAMSTPRGGHAAARLGSAGVLVAGGWVRSHEYTDTTEIFDLETETFRDGPRLRDAVDGLAASTLQDGSVLVTGGQSAPGVASDQAVVIAPDGVASEVGPLLQARFKHASVTLRDGRVLVLGGTPDDQRLLKSTEYYDPETRRFTAGPAMTVGRYKLAGGVALAADGAVVAAGGGRGAEVLDSATDTWAALADVPASRLSFSTVSILGDTLRILGGYDEGIQLTGADIVARLPAGP